MRENLNRGWGTEACCISGGKWGNTECPSLLSHSFASLFAKKWQKGDKMNTSEGNEVSTSNRMVHPHQLVQLTPEEESQINCKFVPLATLMETADFISVHVPLNNKTHHLIDYEKLSPHFAFQSSEVIRQTLHKTTQLAKTIFRFPMRKHFNFRFSMLGRKRLNEVV